MSLILRTVFTFVAAPLLFGKAWAFSANLVRFEELKKGYRILINYTVPELREFREVYVYFADRQSAEKYYWELVRGADFYVPEAKTIKYEQNQTRPEPW